MVMKAHSTTPVLWIAFPGSGGPNAIGLITAVNNSGTITIKTPSTGKEPGQFLIDHGTANGSFTVEAQTTLTLRSYTLDAGATISGAGVTEFSQDLTIAGDVTVSTDLVSGNNVFVPPTLLVEKGATLTLNGIFTQVTASTPRSRVSPEARLRVRTRLTSKQAALPARARSTGT